MKITDLDWKSRGGFSGGDQALVSFPNGYGASVLRGGMYYTTGGTYEIGVLHGEKLDYENPVADGEVLGYQTEEQANAALAAIEALPSKQPEAA